MARSENNLTAVFIDTANAIRSKTGTTVLIEPRDFADAIANISENQGVTIDGINYKYCFCSKDFGEVGFQKFIALPSNELLEKRAATNPTRPRKEYIPCIEIQWNAVPQFLIRNDENSSYAIGRTGQLNLGSGHLITQAYAYFLSDEIILFYNLA